VELRGPAANGSTVQSTGTREPLVLKEGSANENSQNDPVTKSGAFLTVKFTAAIYLVLHSISD
jgi:hypothetical protein